VLKNVVKMCGNFGEDKFSKEGTVKTVVCVEIFYTCSLEFTILEKFCSTIPAYPLQLSPVN